jgi:cytoskeletal protein CcmA (bactofilin family)
MNKINFKNIHSMIGADAIIHGNIELSGGLIVYGKIFGTITTEGPIRVAKNGSVLGDIIASDIFIGGKVEGNVIVKDKAVLGSLSTLLGDLTYKHLLIEEGAQFKGKCELVSSVSDSIED